MERLQVECRVKVATQVIERVQVGQPGAVVTHEVRTFLVVAVDAPYLVYQVASLRLAAYRTVHLDVVYLAVVDEPVTDSGFDRLEELETMKLGTFIMGCALALLACTLAGCDDRLEVRQAYDFSLSSWYLQEGIEPDETVEIRLTLNREGDYREARYRIGYIQLEGDGEVFGTDGTRLVNRELTELSGIAGLDTTDIRRQVFTLFYRNTGGDNPGIRFVAVDNFGVERTLDIPFSIEDRANTETAR